ncbi:hypothetical protein ACLHDG_07520 [Sulfurovum sp. CS9]|uniref:hypothetical protein n=1 Tax=Sulfurovum sp. CS9 TaxID=3391146 RepID=UPI0039E79BB9
MKKLEKENRELKRKNNQLSKENHRFRKNNKWYKKNYQQTRDIQKKYSKQTNAEWRKKERIRNNAKRHLRRQLKLEKKEPIKKFSGTKTSMKNGKTTTTRWKNGNIVEETISVQ